MLEQIMFWAILGHFVGDYLLQSKKMALEKSGPGWKGAWRCFVHCGWYTIAVCWIIQIGTGRTSGAGWSGWVVPMVFLTHYPIDRWSLGDKWLKWIKGRRLEDPPGVVPPGYENVFDNLAEDLPKLSLQAVTGTATQQAFAALVYAVVDNTLHIILMTAGFAALLHWGVI